jgi:hypothetical protein
MFPAIHDADISASLIDCSPIFLYYCVSQYSVQTSSLWDKLGGQYTHALTSVHYDSNGLRLSAAIVLYHIMTNFASGCYYWIA